MSDKKNLKVIIGGAVAVVAALAGVSLIAITVNSGDDNDSRQTGNCNVQGDASTSDCEFEDAEVHASLAVVKGPTANSWLLKLRGWKPGTQIDIELYAPDGSRVEYDEYDTRTVEADGTADTAEGHYFWAYEDGEQPGIYTVTVTGTAQNGETRTFTEEFESPWSAR